MLSKHFPKGFNPRSQQIDILKKIELAIQNNIQNIIISAPTGIGKSHIVKTLSDYFTSSVILTSQIILQDQYKTLFPALEIIKGKPNFICDYLNKDIKNPTLKTAIASKSTADFGNCHSKKKNKKAIYCEYHPKSSRNDLIKKEIKNISADNFPIVNLEWGNKICDYYRQKYDSMFSQQIVLNYAVYFSNILFGDAKNLLGKCRKIIICDEAHLLENDLINFIGKKLSEKEFIGPKHLDSFYKCNWENPSSIKKLIQDLLDEYENYGGEFMYNKFKISTAKYTSRIMKYNQIIGMINNNIDFIVQDEKQTNNTISKSLKPIEISAVFPSFFPQKYRIFVSATINKEMFCNVTGLNPNETDFIDVEKNPFPKKNRKVHFLNISKLSHKSKEADWAKIYNKINSIMDTHHTQKGLILTTSSIQCQNIQDNLSKINKSRLKLVYKNINDGKTVAEILSEHDKCTIPQVLISPSLWYGIDLKDDLSRFQIIVKTPFADLQDKRTKRKMQLDYNWYAFHTVVKLLQGLGRSIRSDTDYATTYILDTHSENLLRSMKEYLPNAYSDLVSKDSI